jgi:hypothetical protein
VDMMDNAKGVAHMPTATTVTIATRYLFLKIAHTATR